VDRGICSPYGGSQCEGLQEAEGLQCVDLEDSKGT
jgi:hypothetical protein